MVIRCTNIQEFIDAWEKVVDASTSTSTSSEWMGPPYGHKISDTWEEYLGIFAVLSFN